MPAFTETLCDRELVQGCLAEEASNEIWRQLFVRFHAYLLVTVRRELGSDGASPDRVQEVVQRLWYALLTQAPKLLSRFDETRCPLRTYLGTLAKQRARWDYLRRHRSERQQVSLSEAQLRDQVMRELPEEAMQEEFLACLTATERDFFLYDLHGRPSPQTLGSRSPAYARLLSMRILHKWQAFWQREDGQAGSRN